MMNINDNNYELWLLRYAEDELSAAERKDVERWLSEHADAASELRMYCEAPRLERDEAELGVAAIRMHVRPLWPLLNGAAAAAAVLLLMLSVMRSAVVDVPQLPQQVAACPPVEIHEPQTTESTSSRVYAKTVFSTPVTIAELAVLDEMVEPAEEAYVDSAEVTPTYREVDDLIVFEDEPEESFGAESVDAVTEVSYVTSAGDGINPVVLFIGTFFKTIR